MPEILGLGWMMKEDHHLFEASLGYIHSTMPTMDRYLVSKNKIINQEGNVQLSI